MTGQDSVRKSGVTQNRPLHSSRSPAPAVIDAVSRERPGVSFPPGRTPVRSRYLLAIGLMAEPEINEQRHGGPW
jgi:hypothetical protein